MLLTLGVFSIVITSTFEDVTAELLDLCVRHDIAYEAWICKEPPARADDTESEVYCGIDMDRVNPAEFKLAGQRILTGTSLTLFENAKKRADEAIGQMTLELYALLAVIETRTVGSRFAVLSQDCIAIEAMVSDLTTETPLPGRVATSPADQTVRIAPQDLLLTLNAALSRMASQALSGTSPILQTECHFWPHSLLGIGVASLALRNIASFITGIVREARYSCSYQNVLEGPAQWSQDAIQENPSLPSYLYQRSEAIANLPGLWGIQLDELVSNEEDELIPTPITYYSGRDGFRNDALTMSAPLPSVAGCNSYQWNLGTITHELSHRILSGKIEGLLQGLLETIAGASLRNKQQVNDFFAVPPLTVRDQAERLLGFTLAVLYRRDIENHEWEAQLRTPEILFRNAKEKYSVTIEETLVHVFDFYHLCGANSKNYVDFVWLSWAVQPMIRRRQEEYIKRTLVALAVKHFAAENWRELAINDFRGILKASPLRQHLKMQPAILEALEDEELYLYHLDTMTHLIALFHLVFRSEKLATLANTERFRVARRGESPTRRTYNYAARKLVFLTDDPGMPEVKFTNPLLFLRDYSRWHKPNAAESAWLLHMLAFNYLASDHDS